MQKLLTFFNKKYWHIWDIIIWNFNVSLTKDVVSFEQPGPDGYLAFVTTLYACIFNPIQ